MNMLLRLSQRKKLAGGVDGWLPAAVQRHRADAELSRRLRLVAFVGRERSFDVLALDVVEAANGLDHLHGLHRRVANLFGQIVDADYAKNTAALTRLEIQQKVSNAMLAQANVNPKFLLTLLGG